MYCLTNAQRKRELATPRLVSSSPLLFAYGVQFCLIAAKAQRCHHIHERHAVQKTEAFEVFTGRPHDTALQTQSECDDSLQT